MRKIAPIKPYALLNAMEIPTMFWGCNFPDRSRTSTPAVPVNNNVQ